MRQLRNVAGNLGEAVVGEVQTFKRVHPVAGCPDGEVTQLVVAGIHLDLRATREGAEHHSKTNKLLINYEPHPPTQRHSSTLHNTRTVCTHDSIHEAELPHIHGAPGPTQAMTQPLSERLPLPSPPLLLQPLLLLCRNSSGRP